MKPVLRVFVLFGVLGSVVWAVGCRRTAAPPSPPPLTEDASFTALRDRYFLQHLKLNPVTSTYLGGDGYSAELADINGKLRDYSPFAIDAELGSYREVEEALKGLNPAMLSPTLRIDYQLMGAQLAFLLREIGERRYYQRALDTYINEPFRGVDWQIQQMQDLGDGQLGTEQEWNLVIARVGAIPRYLETARTNLLAGKQVRITPDRRMVEFDGLAGSKANAEYFRNTLVRLATGYIGNRPFSATVLARLTDTSAAAATAWESFETFLHTTFDLNEKVDRFSTGTEEYEWRVHNVLRDPRRATDLFAYGAQQVALYTARTVEVARKVAQEAGLNLGFGSNADKAASLRAVMAHLSRASPKSDEELFTWYRETVARAVSYGRERALFEIPEQYNLDVVPTPPVLHSAVEAAYYPAPPFKKAGVGRFYLTPTGNVPAALKLNNRASVADTAIHEGFPGHDWHFKYMTQYAAQISNIRWLTPGAVEDSSSMWSDSMATEGWALYAEELMSEPAPGRPYGFYSAGEYLYALQGQLMRAVRVHVDVGIHTSQMSFNEAVDYFAEHVTFYPRACALAASDATARAVCDTAQRAIYRYSKWPTQALTYNLGKSAMVDLREAYRATRGSAFSDKSFHEKFMRMGTVPVGYFRESFLEE